MCCGIYGKSRQRLVYQLGRRELALLIRYVIFALALYSIIGIAHAQEVSLGMGGNTKTIEVGKQIQIAADLKNGQDFDQNFAYIVQIQDENGITVSLSWITGTLTPAQSFSPSLSWIPDQAGKYNATIFVWESIDNPSALSPTLSLQIDVGQST